MIFNATRMRRLGTLLERTTAEAMLVTNPKNIKYLCQQDGTFLLIVKDGFHVFRPPMVGYHDQTKVLLDEVVEVIKSYGLRFIGIESSHCSIQDYTMLTERYPDIGWIPLKGLVEQLRMVKDKEEISLLRLACQIAADSWYSLGDRTARAEKDIALNLEWNARIRGAEGLSFSPMGVASGPRSSIVHGIPTERHAKPGEGIVVDFGVQYQGYMSDETVTVLADEGALPSWKDYWKIRECVYEAQQRAIEMIKPGRLASEIDRVARSIIERAGYGPNFPHNSGHGIGLDVHELPMVGPGPSSDIILEEGMVITVEPGIYIPGQGGVRIEDMLLVTELGCEQLTMITKS